MVMKLANNSDTPNISIRFKHDGGNSYSHAVFNETAVRLFDTKYPNRTHIDVYVDIEAKSVGFKIKSTNKNSRHVKHVSTTKAMRQLDVQVNISQIELVYDNDLDMYVAHIG